MKQRARYREKANEVQEESLVRRGEDSLRCSEDNLRCNEELGQGEGRHVSLPRQRTLRLDEEGRVGIRILPFLAQSLAHFPRVQIPYLQ